MNLRQDPMRLEAQLGWGGAGTVGRVLLTSQPRWEIERVGVDFCDSTTTSAFNEPELLQNIRRCGISVRNFPIDGKHTGRMMSC